MSRDSEDSDFCALCGKGRKPGEAFRDVRNVHVHWARLMELRPDRRFLSEWASRKAYYSNLPGVKLEKHFKCFSAAQIATAFAYPDNGKKCHKHCLHAFNFTVKVKFDAFCQVTGFRGDRPNFVKFSKTDMPLGDVAHLMQDDAVLTMLESTGGAVAPSSAAPVTRGRRRGGGAGAGAGAGTAPGYAPVSSGVPSWQYHPPSSLAPPAPTHQNPFDAFFDSKPLSSPSGGLGPDLLDLGLESGTFDLDQMPATGQPDPWLLSTDDLDSLLASTNDFPGAMAPPPLPPTSALAMGPASTATAAAAAASGPPSTHAPPPPPPPPPPVTVPVVPPPRRSSRHPVRSRRRIATDDPSNLSNYIAGLTMEEPADPTKPAVTFSVCGVRKVFVGAGPFLIGRSSKPHRIRLPHTEFYQVSDVGAQRFFSRKTYYSVALVGTTYHLQIVCEDPRDPTHVTTFTQAATGSSAHLRRGHPVPLAVSDLFKMGPVELQVLNVYVPPTPPAPVQAVGIVRPVVMPGSTAPMSSAAPAAAAAAADAPVVPIAPQRFVPPPTSAPPPVKHEPRLEDFF